MKISTSTVFFLKICAKKTSRILKQKNCENEATCENTNL